ncbi:hypothetical protein BKP35_05315 [Anaerobacillus arseniciselenatis]|uniref:DUF4363 domain-containing protein n=1 Tax=Anaerobacillus arseniciselenatis TaxID=85682 RepID=A0A1S2LRY2_9BACI|nr:DUF4363 family protein [Anaerobacillus arseniciselenatis]OIJ15268.1 hypothetical protein BKP35_05315 [Anaerobacillus arseniciselenatis]
MAKTKILIAILFLLIFNSGCDLIKTEKDRLLLQSTTELEQLIKKEDWETAMENIEKFERHYDQRKWKLQLLGELEDYKEIELQLLSLKENINNEEETEAIISIKQINHLLNIIYNL